MGTAGVVGTGGPVVEAGVVEADVVVAVGVVEAAGDRRAVRSAERVAPSAHAPTQTPTSAPVRRAAATVLVIEQDPRLAAALSAGLGRCGYRVELNVPSRGTVEAGDVVVIDLDTGGNRSLETCRLLHERGAGIVAIIGRNGPVRVSALRAGAAVVLAKPLGLLELRASVDLVLRDTMEPACRWLTFGRLMIDLVARQVSVDGQPVALTHKEYQVLVLLARGAGAVVTRAQLLEEVWQTSWQGKSRTVDVHLATLRAKVGQVAMIESVRGVGYRMVQR